jgi:hypothetical protein
MSCNGFPTKDSSKRFENNAISANEYVTSPLDTFTDQDGGVHLTIEGQISRTEKAIEDTIAKSNIGVWAVGVTTFNFMNEYAEFNGVAYKPKSGITLPYVAQTSSPLTPPDSDNVEPFSDINSSNLPGYTDLRFATVADVLSGTTIGGISVSLQVGDRIVIEERAGQDFICGSLAANGFNILQTSTPSVTAELINKSGEYILEAWGVDLSGASDSSDAWQALVYGIENSVPANTNAYSGSMIGGRGEIKLTKPILFKQLDGISFKGAGKRGTGIICDGAMTPVLDSFFSSINGTGGRGYTYDQPCAFMFAASRKVGGANGFDDPSGGNVTSNNVAAWFFEWSDFYIKGAPDTIDLGTLTVNAFFGPTFAHGLFRNIDFQFLRAPIMVNDIYRTRIADCDIRNCKYPFDHATLNGFTPQGTSLTIENTGASRTIFGWKFFGLSYSSIDAAIDDWGFGLTSGVTEYAYDFETCMGLTLISSGCESSQALAAPRILRLAGTQAVDVIGLTAKIFNYDNAANTELYTIDGCNVNWKSGLPTGGFNATKYIGITGFSRVNFESNWKSTGENIIERITSDAFANINVDPYDEPYVLLFQGASDSGPIPTATALTGFPRVETNTTWGNSSGIDNGDMVSTYEIRVSGSVSGQGWDRIELNYGGVGSNVIRCWLDQSITGPQTVSINSEIIVQPNEDVRVFAYNSFSTGILLSGFTISIRRITGRTL